MNFLTRARGAIDLASIMVGVIIIGIIAGVISATVFAVIPWTQDSAAKESLGAVHTAEATARAGIAGGAVGVYMDSAALNTAGFLKTSGSMAVTTNPAGSCFAALSASASGNHTYYISDKQRTAVEYVSQSDCVDVSALANSISLAPVPAITASYPAMSFARASASTFTPTVTGGNGTFSYSTTDTLPYGVTLDPVTGKFTGPATWTVSATQIASTMRHSCIVTPETTVQCWGSNSAGQLDNGNTSQTFSPTDAIGLTGIKQVVTGSQSTCVLTANDGVKCWGANWDGVVGDGTNTDRLTPTDVFGLTSGVKSIAMVNSTACAVKIDGTLLCWGTNSWSQIGNGNAVNQNKPVVVSGFGEAVRSVHPGGTNTCAVTVSDAVWCWGYGGNGNNGDGTTNSSTAPRPVTGLGAGTGTVAVAASSSSSCALSSAGTVKCWGTNIGDGTTATRTTPVSISSLTGIVSLNSGFEKCAIKANGDMYCWGSNTYGNIGDGTTTTQLSPVFIIGGVSSVSMGGEQTCAVVSGAAMCWGSNSYGAVGANGGPTPRYVTRSGFTKTVTVAVKSGSRTLNVTATLTLV